jgi:competence protein ComEA
MILLLGIVLVAVGVGINFKEKLMPTEKVELIKSDVQVDNKVTIDIEGEVIKPGVYELDRGSRISEILVMAGGLSAEADREWVEKNINQAQILNDGQKIFIPNVGAIHESPVQIGINNASIEELDKLSGVGPSLAQKIIDYRTKNGGFKNIEEIKLVPGVGDKMFLKIKDQIGL